VPAEDVFPAASVATTPTVYVVFAVNPVKLVAVFVLIATKDPSRSIEYETTPTLSVLADQETSVLV